MAFTELHEHQKKAVKELGNGKILVGGVGTGKSLTAAAYYVEREAPRDVYVITTAKKRDSLDWEDEFVHFGVGKQRDATVHGVLTVDSWNNIDRYLNVKDAFFVFDEQRVVGSGKWSKSFVKIAKRNRWVLLSATPGDTWLDYVPVFVANGFYKNRTEFKRDHCVYSYYGKFPKLERYTGVGKLVRLRKQLLVEMPYERHTIRHISTVNVDFDKGLLERVTKQRWNVFKDRPLKDIAELFGAARKVVNTDDTRLSTVRALMERHPRLIVFYNFDYELEMLRTLADPSPNSGTSSMSSVASAPPKSSSTSSSESVSTQDSATSQSTSSSFTTSPSRSSFDQKSSPSSDLCSTRSGSGSRASSPAPTPSTDTGGSECLNAETPSASTRATVSSISTSRKHSGDSINTESCHYLSPTRSDSESPKKPWPPSEQSSLERSSGTTTSTPGWTRTDSGGLSVCPEDHDLYRAANPRLQEGSSSTGCTCPNTGSACGVEGCDGATQGVAGRDPKLSAGSVDLEAPLTVAEWNGHKHEAVPKTDRWVYLVQYVAGSEGWNCTSTDAMVFWSLTYSYKNWAQAFGRIDRLNTPYTHLYYYVLQSKSWIDLAVRRSLDAKKSFNESAIGQKF